MSDPKELAERLREIAKRAHPAWSSRDTVLDAAATIERLEAEVGRWKEVGRMLCPADEDIEDDPMEAALLAENLLED